MAQSIRQIKILKGEFAEIYKAEFEYEGHLSSQPSTLKSFDMRKIKKPKPKPKGY